MITKPIAHWAEPSVAPGEKRPGVSEIQRKLETLPRPVSQPHTLKARGVDVGTLVFRVLMASELGSVFADAHTSTSELMGEDAKGSVAYEEIYLEQKALHLVALACRQPDDPQFPTFFTAKGVREHLTDDEIGVVLAAYNIFRRESGPITSEIGDIEAGAWFAILSKGTPNRMALSRCSPEALIDLVLYAAERLKQSETTAEGTDGTEADSGTERDGAVAPDVATPATSQ